MSRNGRESYRAPIDQQEGFEFVVKSAAGELLSGALLDLSEAGAAARFPRETIPTLAIGLETACRLTGPWLRTPIELTATVVNRQEQEGFRRYGFQFENPEALGGQIPQLLYMLFTGRSAIRVKPDQQEPVEVTLKIPEGLQGLTPGLAGLEAKGRMADVSANGLGVFVELDAEARGFDAVDEVETHFCLPPGGKLLRLRAKIRNRRSVGEVVAYGLQFDRKHAEPFGPQQHEIGDYVVRRQREEGVADVLAEDQRVPKAEAAG